MRTVIHRSRGIGHGPIVRLMSPGDLGQVLKPFVFLDMFEASMQRRGAGAMPLHPHSGIATVTVFTTGEVYFEDPRLGRRSLGNGGAEWTRAGKGIWHGGELSGGASAVTQGFQLWLALPPELETAEAESQYLEAHAIPTVGPGRLVVGDYQGIKSPARAPAGVNYLVVSLRPGEQWSYHPPAGHEVLWLAVARGSVVGDAAASKGELLAFEAGEAPITLAGGDDGATFVLGSAVPHPHALHLGRHSVHTSPEALAIGERHIVELKQRIDAGEVVDAKSSPMPVYRG